MQDFPTVAAAAKKYHGHPPLKSEQRGTRLPSPHTAVPNDRACNAANMIVIQAIASPHYLGLQDGDRCDVLDILQDNTSIIVRAADGRVGYYNIDFIATEDEVLAVAPPPSVFLLFPPSSPSFLSFVLALIPPSFPLPPLLLADTLAGGSQILTRFMTEEEQAQRNAEIAAKEEQRRREEEFEERLREVPGHTAPTCSGRLHQGPGRPCRASW
jgi:hypothetical protein